MKNREPLTIDVRNVSEDGCGYSEDGRYAVFGGISGEVVTAIPLVRRHKRLYLTVSTVQKASPDRVDPECEVADICGGCSWQHMSQPSQLEMKTRFFKKQLFPLEPEEWLVPVVGSRFGYRSKARLGVKYVEKKKSVLVGFREKQRSFITDTNQCPIIIERCRRVIPDLRNLIEKFSIKSAIPQVDLIAGDTEVALVFRHLEPLSDRDLELLEIFSVSTGFWVYLQSSGLTSIKKMFPKSTTENLTYKVPEFDLNFKFGPQDFTQVNLKLNQQMISCVIGMLDLSLSDHVLDAFCGIGNFSLAMARSAGRVTGLELSSSSIERAKSNAHENGIRNVVFEVADLHLEKLKSTGKIAFNKLLLDPPRSGAEALMKELDPLDVERVVYVSCNPTTFARDAKILCQRGFTLRSVGIIDMFPNTTHVESIALFYC